MTPSATPRTHLAALLMERGWSASRFCRIYQKTAQDLQVGSGYLAERTAKRWILGEVTTPRAPAPAVLHTLFGTDVATLFGPPIPQPPRDAPLTDIGTLAPTRRASDHGHTPAGPDQEVSTSRRRDLLNAGIVLTATGAALGPAQRAAKISRAITAARPDPLTLAELQHGVQRLTTLYPTTPFGALVEPIERAWDDAEALLETRVSGTARRDLELVAGQYAWYRGQLAFDMADDQTALTFLVLAAQHAEAAGDTLLAGSVAVIRSALTFFAGDFRGAATIARRGQPDAHPYVAPVLAGCLARALAQTGDSHGAHTALHTMQDTVWTASPLPGPSIGDAEFCAHFTAVTYTYLNQGEDAEPITRQALSLLDGTGRHHDIAGMQLALARSLIRRQTPEPEQAALAVSAALTAAAGNDHGSTTDRAAGIYRTLTARQQWAQLPAVRDLRDQLPDRRALSPSAAI
ncbi:hypothetical protein I6A60_33725 [Frankia sp. AgB1.9]|nr:hypothetical protein [Frankia sp. AgW1.1]MBL7552781.1 hypothetical protein [Frankia sp. AgB1.9]MBL7625334.1 hypothetical protein [Frankia sp. AgB1.8]